MAKIEDLSVDRIHFAPHAVHGVVTSASAVTVPNASGAPILISAGSEILWLDGGQGLTATLTVNLQVRRTRGTLDVINRQLSFSGSNFGSKTVRAYDGTMDADASTTDTYTLTVTPTATNSSIGSSSPTIRALYTKR